MKKAASPKQRRAAAMAEHGKGGPMAGSGMSKAELHSMASTTNAEMKKRKKG